VLVALAGCSRIDMPKLRWPFKAKPTPVPEVVDELVFEAPAPDVPVSAFPQYFRRNTLIIDMTAATGQGVVLMKPKTQFGWPARVAFRVKPGNFEALEVRGEQRLLLPVIASAQRPTLDLELPPNFLKARSDAGISVRWGLANPPPPPPPPPEVAPAAVEPAATEPAAAEPAPALPAESPPAQSPPASPTG
jgi:hypothetical protein